LKFQDESEKLRRRYENKIPAPKAAAESGFMNSPFGLFEHRVTSPASTHSRTSLSPQQEWDTKALDIRDGFKAASFFSIFESPTSFLRDDESLKEASNFVEEGKTSTGLIPSNQMRSMKQALDTFCTVASTIYCANLQQNQLLDTFAQAFTPPAQTRIPEAMRNHSRWLSHLPLLTGSNALLDSAIRSVSLAHLGRLNNEDVFVNEARPHYGKALRLLNSALTDRTKYLNNETLCAVMLLSFYEMLVNDSNEPWIKHAGGAGALMKIRGPQRHRYGFGREMFLAYRHTIIIEAFQRDQACFLNEPEWRKVSREIHEDIRAQGIQEPRMRIFDVAEDLYSVMASIPVLFRDARSLRDAGKTNSASLAHRKYLLERMKENRLQLKATFIQFRDMLAKAGHAQTSYLSGDDVIPFYYAYMNLFVASSFTGYWTILVLLNALIQELESSPETASMYLVENREAAYECCRTAEYMLTSSVLGPFFAIFALRVCLLVFQSGSPERDWVIKRLFHIGNTRMGMAKHIPGFIPGTPMPLVRHSFQTITLADAPSESEPLEHKSKIIHME